MDLLGSLPRYQASGLAVQVFLYSILLVASAADPVRDRFFGQGRFSLDPPALVEVFGVEAEEIEGAGERTGRERLDASPSLAYVA